MLGTESEAAEKGRLSIKSQESTGLADVGPVTPNTGSK